MLMLVPQLLPSFNTEKAHQSSFHPSYTFFVTNDFAPEGPLMAFRLGCFCLRSDHVALIKGKFVSKGLVRLGTGLGWIYTMIFEPPQTKKS